MNVTVAKELYYIFPKYRNFYIGKFSLTLYNKSRLKRDHFVMPSIKLEMTATQLIDSSLVRLQNLVCALKFLPNLVFNMAPITTVQRTRSQNLVCNSQ